MLSKRIECDRCHQIILEYKKTGHHLFDALDTILKAYEESSDKEKMIGYAEINLIIIGAEMPSAVIHLCENCYNETMEFLNRKAEKRDETGD